MNGTNFNYQFTPMADIEIKAPAEAPEKPVAVAQDAPPPRDSGVLAVISRAAQDPSVDVDKMERLLNMQWQLMDRQASEAYAKAMANVQSEVPAIVKDADNSQTRSKYAKLEQINKVLVPIYTREGFSLSFGTEPSSQEAHLRITCSVAHVGGHTENFAYDLPYDDRGIGGKVNKTGIHASGSTVTYGRRYLTNMIFNLSTTDDDDDGNMAGMDHGAHMIKNATIERVMQLIEEKGFTVDRCLGYINTVDSVSLERLTQLTEKQAEQLIHKMESLGGAA